MGKAVVKTAAGENPAGGRAGARTDFTREDFLRAVDQTREQLRRFQQSIQERVTEPVSQIFGAHLTILDDAQFTGRIRKRIEGGAAVIDAVDAVVNDYSEILSQSPSSRIREKVQDLGDLSSRIVSNLDRPEGSEPAVDYHGKIIITSSLFPSDMLRLVAQNAEGVILTTGGVTAHISVLAQSLEIPLILADAAHIGAIADGTPLLMDAHQGIIHINPDATVLAGYKALLETRGRPLPVAPGAEPRTLTKDGRRIRLLAAIGLVSEAKIARGLNAEGIGLYRTEMPFLIRNGFPTKDEQYAVYRAVMEEMDGRDIVFRTLDIGGDKILRYFPLRTESNPFLGLRGIRLTLRYREIFDTQVRALVQAAFDRPLKIMFPLVASVDSFLYAKGLVKGIIADLKARAVPHQSAPEVGVMIELPCAVGMAEELAQAADFLSIGSSDLIQYMLAIDRTNEQMADWYAPWHPAILRAVASVIKAAKQWKKPVSVCGDMAGTEELIPVLIGMGLTDLTIAPGMIPKVQRLIQGIDASAAQRLSEQVLASPTVAQAARLIGAKWKPAWENDGPPNPP